MMTFSLRPLLLAVLLAASPAAAETITLATYNIENFRMNFEAHRIARELAKRAADPEMLEIIATERQQNDEDNWEIASVILDPRVSPDIIVIQEGCRESDLKYFNNRWLRGAYETVFVFNTNTTRDQNLGIMLKPGFKVIERKDDFHLEPDPIPNPRGETFFARGPGFVLVESPSGYRFWVGNTHQKSKGGNNPEVSAWRHREAKRTSEILRELEHKGPSDIILLGDMNDALGVQDFEGETGGDAIATLLGGEKPYFILATRALAESGAISFGGYWQDRYRSMIDHIVISPSVKDQVQEVYIYNEGLAAVASDHYPVIIKIKADPPGPATQPAAAAH